MGKFVPKEKAQEIRNKWKCMPKNSDVKKWYESEAEVDEKRFTEELFMFLKKDSYLPYLKDKTESGPAESIDEFLQRDRKSINCLICNQTFSTLHNKEDHLLGITQLISRKTSRNSKKGMSLNLGTSYLR